MTSPPSTSEKVWRELYMTALFETDKQILPMRIGEAERALILRARELFGISGNECEEAKAVEKALYAMRGLRHCQKLEKAEPLPLRPHFTPSQSHPINHGWAAEGDRMTNNFGNTEQQCGVPADFLPLHS